MRHLPRGRCGLKYQKGSLRLIVPWSPSARKVWIEISLSPFPSTYCTVTFREEGVDWNLTVAMKSEKLKHVTFREEGVDWNVCRRLAVCRCHHVTFREEGVDWNHVLVNSIKPIKVTFREEGVDWNGSSIWILSRVVSSPSARKVWIEISFCPNWFVSIHVTFREEGVDWNILMLSVTLRLFCHLPRGRCGLK